MEWVWRRLAPYMRVRTSLETVGITEEALAKEKAERPFRLSITSIHGCFPILSDEELEYMWALIEEYKKREGMEGS